MKKVAIIQARMGSTRFLNKVLKDLGDKPMLKWVVEAAHKIPLIDHVVVATSDLNIDDKIANFCDDHKISCYRGNEKDVLSRFYDAATAFQADIIVRITSDCPLLDPYIAGQVLYLVANGQADYASNIAPPTWPDGLDCEAFTMNLLKEAYTQATRLSDREHVTPYIRNNQYKYKVLNVTSPIANLHKYRWTIDTEKDLDFINLLVQNSPKNASTYDFLETLKNNPHIVQSNDKRNEGFEKSFRNENIQCIDFNNSQKLLKKSLNYIPLGTQTFSKSYIQYPENQSPLFLTHGQGARTWDVDGNEYIDLVSGLHPNILGYNDPDVNYAIQAQLQKGITFSLATELEINLAEKLSTIIPSGEKFRFAKNGTDVTSAAVRLARAYTGRDKVILCGYHGWQDWSIGTTTRNKGVPQQVRDLSLAIPYNDLNKVEVLLKTETFAGIILEPCNSVKPEPGYLQGIKDLCEKYGTIFIFDEIITGFRFDLGGAQKYFGVTPHLSCFGKSMGNGMPISAIAGQNFIMKEMDEIFFSGTFGGETLSLTASLATIKKIEEKHVIEHLWSYGEELENSIQELIVKYNVDNVISLLGYAPWKILQFSDHDYGTSFEIKTLFIQEMLFQGVLINSSLNINFSHEDLEKQKIIKAFDNCIKIIKDVLCNNNLNKFLKSPAIKPLFRVR